MSPILWRKKSECSGCGACYQICPKSAINMCEDEFGFVYPFINNDKCVKCNRCLNVCPIKNNELKDMIKGDCYAVRHKNDSIRMNSSSGGAFTAICEIFKPDLIYGAAFSDFYQLRHIGVKYEDLALLRGSKYLQSNTLNTFYEVKEKLKSGEKILYVGTPCQIAGLKNYLQYDYNSQLFTCDFICSGVQSQNHFDKFLNYIGVKDKKDIITVDFKNKKRFGWERSDFLVEAKGNPTYIKQTYTTDSPYMNSFLFKGGCRDSCYNCHFAKLPRRSDITLADFWGWKDTIPEWNDNLGISLAFANSENGLRICEKLNEVSYIKKICISEAVVKNPNLINSPKEPVDRIKFLSDLNQLPYQYVVKKWLKPRPLYRRLLSILIFRIKSICNYKNVRKS